LLKSFIFMSLEEEITVIQEMKNQGALLIEEAAKRMASLQEALRFGRISSGDKIIDLIVSQSGTFNQEYIDAYRKLNEKLKTKRGEVVLVYHLTREKNPLSKDRIEMSLQFGIFSSDAGLEIDIQKGNIIIPTRKHLEATQEYTESDEPDVKELRRNEPCWRTLNGPIIETYKNLVHLTKKKEQKEPEPKFTKESNILVGQRVIDYFDANFDSNPKQDPYLRAVKLLRCRV